MTVRKADKICGKTDKNWKESIYKIMHFYTDQRRADAKIPLLPFRETDIISQVAVLESNCYSIGRREYKNGAVKCGDR